MFYTNTTNTLNDLFRDLNTIFESSGYPTNKYNHKVNTQINSTTESDDNGVTLTMEVPGYNDNLIDVTVEGKTLVIEGKSNSGNLDGFKEKFSLGDKFDGKKVEALIVDGLLTVSVPYVESVKPRKVKVKVG